MNDPLELIASRYQEKEARQQEAISVDSADQLRRQRVVLNILNDRETCECGNLAPPGKKICGTCSKLKTWKNKTRHGRITNG